MLYLFSSLPARLGGLGFIDPVTESSKQFSDSVFILSPFVEAIVSKSGAPIVEVIKSRKNKTKSNHRVYNSQLSSTLYDILPDHSLRRCLEVASEKGASSWLTTIPIAEHGFHLHKGAFRNAICLWYGLTPPHFPTECVCDSPFSVVLQ